MMSPEDVRQLLLAELVGCEVVVNGEGNHFDIVVIGEIFSGLRPVKKQQLVYAPLNQCIADGSVHAVNIKTYTAEEWAATSPGSD
jgi:acid stress-induced BolA-like protein IbaG/YrbA